MNQCAVCYEDIEQEVVLPCNHSFCKDCILNWSKQNIFQLNETCPLCRNQFKLCEITIKNNNNKRTTRSDTEKIRVRFFIKKFQQQVLDFENLKNILKNLPDDDTNSINFYINKISEKVNYIVNMSYNNKWIFQNNKNSLFKKVIKEKIDYFTFKCNWKEGPIWKYKFSQI